MVDSNNDVYGLDEFQFPRDYLIRLFSGVMGLPNPSSLVFYLNSYLSFKSVDNILNDIDFSFVVTSSSCYVISSLGFTLFNNILKHLQSLFDCRTALTIMHFHPESS